MQNRQLMGIPCSTHETQTRALHNLEGWDGEGGGRDLQEEGDIDTPMADSC